MATFTPGSVLRSFVLQKQDTLTDYDFEVSQVLHIWKVRENWSLNIT